MTVAGWLPTRSLKPVWRWLPVPTIDAGRQVRLGVTAVGWMGSAKPLRSDAPYRDSGT